MYKEFSIIIPIYNEAENILILLDEIKDSIKSYKNYEIIVINDSSTDNTLDLLSKNIQNSSIHIFNNKKNYGQSYSIHKGIQLAKSNTIVTIDGDGQNDPKDIEKLLNIYREKKDVKLVGGIRNKRKDTILKILSSKIANSLRSFILKDNCPDTGCALKVFDKKIFLEFIYFDGIHRFLPALFNGYKYKTIFINVNHRNRKYGFSKYGTIKRALKGIIDIIRVIKLINKTND